MNSSTDSTTTPATPTATDAAPQAASDRERYQHEQVEQKWRNRWEADQLYALHEDESRPKWYAVTMYPYPSGDMHIGHWYAMTPSDAAARYRRMNGYNVFFPMGFDAFGLPAENAAIKRGAHPFRWTMANVDNMRDQLRTMGAMFDWSHSVVTCTPEYYKWNQWFFLEFLKHDLVYKKEAAVWWCPNCQTVLANEQVVDGKCERCGAEVSNRMMSQWFFRITKYADELLSYDGLEWPERVRVMQRNWIGRSEGARVTFQTEHGDPIEVFTTRPDTLWGATFMVLAPEHPLVATLTTPEQADAVAAYQDLASRQSEIERMSTDEAKPKTGVFTGGYAINPVNQERIPVWIADYVLFTYGTGAIMAVPAHDERDFAFAHAFGLEIRPVVEHPDPEQRNADPYTFHHEYGTLINSGELTGTSGDEARERALAHVETIGAGTRQVNYRMRDWLISRQRYWGTPFPIIYCDTCGIVTVPEEDLPVLLPEDAEFEPSGVSPLRSHAGFLNVPCPQCGGPGRRETDTMDTFVDSSWYWFRYLTPDKTDGPIDRDMVARWTPLDQYTGGIEHATMHLLYARAWTKAMRDMGMIDFGEPFLRLRNQGIILGEDSEKMSKSRGNVVDPDDLVAELGSDVVRLFLMFLGPWDQGGPWNSRGITGPARFLDRVFTIVGSTVGNATEAVEDDATRSLRRLTHQTIRAVTEDYERFSFNTMVARMMEFGNELMKLRETPVAHTAAWREALEALPLLLAPAAPHASEELWERLGHSTSVHLADWPSWDEALATDETVTIAVQVNGKVRDRIELAPDATQEVAMATARASEKVQEYLNAGTVQKEIYVPGRLISFVVR